eukprot:m.57313 g.57313  ORF g.57313 m.57313 type:complete len:317 (-) comp17073_c0_seq1:285-1235(-)
MAAEDGALRTAFDQDGIAVIPGFCSEAECDAMRARMGKLLDEWDSTQKVVAFSTAGDQEEAQGSSSYFLDSADRIHFFLEPAATTADGVSLLPGREKHTSINKVGHGLHVLDPVFREYSSSEKVLQLAQSLGWVAPVLPQSMYIFKQPKIGGEVTSHQDSTFLYTEPRQTCLGLWLALEDATLENGCLWGRKGSHKEPVRRRFARNPAYFSGNTEVPMLVFEQLATDEEQIQWEGQMPEGDDVEAAVRAAGFVPLPVKKGDLVAIHGQVDHLSLSNVSPKSRHTYQLHLVEGPTEGVTWSARNWLQYPKGQTFPKV